MFCSRKRLTHLVVHCLPHCLKSTEVGSQLNLESLKSQASGLSVHGEILEQSCAAVHSALRKRQRQSRTLNQTETERCFPVPWAVVTPQWNHMGHTTLV